MRAIRRPTLKVLNSRVLYTVFESKREEVSGGRRQLYFVLISFMRWPGNVGRKGEKEISMRIKEYLDHISVNGIAV